MVGIQRSESMFNLSNAQSSKPNRDLCFKSFQENWQILTAVNNSYWFHKYLRSYDVLNLTYDVNPNDRNPTFKAPTSKAVCSILGME